MLVVGAGPAGAVAATLLARAGARVVVMHRPGRGGPTIGEVLPSAARPTFVRLDLGDVLGDPGHADSPGTVSVWGSEVPFESDFLFSPYGAGLHLDRARFDEHLRELAVMAGAEVVPEAIGSAAAWSALSARSERGDFRVLLDCSGRSAVLARARGARIERFDALVAVAGLLAPGSGSPDLDARTYVAAGADGWWYSALLPDGHRVAAFQTDHDLLEPAMRRDPTTWHRRLLGVPAIGALVRASGAGPPTVLRVLAADSRRMRWPGEAAASASARASAGGSAMVVLAGDAAMAFDPLSSMGILAAIGSAEEAVAVVLAQLEEGSRAALAAADRRLGADQTRWTSYLDRLAEAYGSERRWSASPFWARRHAWRTDRRSTVGARAQR